MSRGLRTWAAAATALAMLATSAPALAESEKYDSRANAPAMVDVMILRPMGFVPLATGTALFAAISPIMLITRPHEINKHSHLSTKMDAVCRIDRPQGTRRMRAADVCPHYAVSSH